MKKGVEYKLAMGVIALACLDLVMLLSLITGINFFTEENLVFIILPTLALAFVIGRKLHKNYDEDDNYDGYVYFISFLLLCILVVGIIIIGKR